jgi:anti-sigma-K factor RskA
MNIQEYIQSGILDLYVTDLLSPAEQREVQRMAQIYPEIQTEITAIETALEQYASAAARTPRPEIKAQLLRTLESNNAADLTTHQNTAPTLTVHLPQTPQLPFYSRPLAAAAAVALLVVSGASNLFLYQNWQTAKARTETLLAEKTQLAELNTAEAAYYQDAIATLTHPNIKTIALKAQPFAPNTKVTIFWSKERGTTLATIQNLAHAPEGKQYQLWALLDGKPIDAGLLDTTNTTQHMKTIVNAQAFAITLEPKGGSASPHLEALCAMNTI